jgi:hypothetical protein
MVDAAMRTGGELTAMYSAIEGSLYSKKCVVGFVIAATEDKRLIVPIDGLYDEGFEVHSFVTVPLLPSAGHLIDIPRDWRSSALKLITYLENKEPSFSDFKLNSLFSKSSYREASRPEQTSEKLRVETRFVSRYCISEILDSFLGVRDFPHALKATCALDLLAFGQFSWIDDISRQILVCSDTKDVFGSGDTLIKCYLLGLLWVQAEASKGCDPKMNKFAEDCLGLAKIAIQGASSRFLFKDTVCESQDFLSRLKRFVDWLDRLGKSHIFPQSDNCDLSRTRCVHGRTTELQSYQRD